MGDAKIYWYPDQTGTLETIDLGGNWSRLTFVPERSAAVSQSMTGQAYVIPGVYRRRVTLEWEKRVISDDLGKYTGGFALESHLMRGGLIHVTTNSAKVFWGVVLGGGDGGIDRGETDLSIKDNPFQLWETSAFGANDVMVIESSAPEQKYERRGATTVGNKAVVLANGLINSYRQDPMWVISEDFWPFLRRDVDLDPVISWDPQPGLNGLVFTMRLSLVVDYGAMARGALFANGTQFKGVTTSPDPTIDQVVADPDQF